MRKADLPAAASELLTARERRESERLVTDWEQEKRWLGDALALMTLDVSAMWPEVGTPVCHRRPSNRRGFILAFLRRQTRLALGIAAEA